MSEQQDVRKSERVTKDTLKKRENNETEALEAFWNLHASIIKSKDIALSAIIDVTSCEELKHIDAIMQKMMSNLTSAFEDVELNAVTDIPEDVETAQLTTVRLLDEISASLQHKISGMSVADCHDKNSHSSLPPVCNIVPVHDKSEDVELSAVITDIPQDVQTAQATTVKPLDEISASLQHKLSGVSVPDCHDKNSHSLLPSLCTKVPVHDKSEDDRSKRKKKEEIDKSPL